MTIRHLRIFIAVCDTGSITAAGQALFIAQPSVSVAIAELESYYGVKLFDRISRRLHITQDGRRFLEYARHIVSLFDEMEHTVRDHGATGTLRVGGSVTPGASLLPRIAGQFAALLPQVQLFVSIDRPARLEGQLLSGELDLAVIKGRPKSEKLAVRPFGQDELVVAFGPTHPLAARREPLTPAELITQDLILREKGSGARDLLDSALSLFHLTAVPVWESISSGAIIAALEAGLGVSVLSRRSIAEPLRTGRLLTLPLSGMDLTRPFLLVYHENKYLSPAAQAFIDLCLAAGEEEGETA